METTPTWKMQALDALLADCRTAPNLDALLAALVEVWAEIRRLNAEGNTSLATDLLQRLGEMAPYLPTFGGTVSRRYNVLSWDEDRILIGEGSSLTILPRPGKGRPPKGEAALSVKTEIRLTPTEKIWLKEIAALEGKHTSELLRDHLQVLSVDPARLFRDERLEGLAGAIWADLPALDALLEAVESKDAEAAYVLECIQFNRQDGDDCGWRSFLSAWMEQ